MRRITFPFLALALLGGLFTLLTPPAGAGDGCAPGQVELRGRVRDAATGLPLDEVTGVEVYVGSVPYDGYGTDENSRYSICLPPGSYKIRWFADNYRIEWYQDQPNNAEATEITLAPGSDPVVANASLTPRGRVIAGRVTNLNGVPKFASVGIWRLTSTGWKPYDGIANNLGNGWYEFHAPGPGRYRIEADVDHHKSRWATSATHLSAARTFVLGVQATFINDGHIRVPYCTTGGGDFCVPPGFFS
jgi:hypothetical protein